MGDLPTNVRRARGGRTGSRSNRCFYPEAYQDYLTFNAPIPICPLGEGGRSWREKHPERATAKG